jgi:hypothetical protein
MGEPAIFGILNEKPGPRVSRYLVIAYFLEVGLILILVPWSTFWERNYFAHVVPAVEWMVRSHAVRGAVSGLGVVNVLAGIADLVKLIGARRR